MRFLVLVIHLVVFGRKTRLDAKKHLFCIKIWHIEKYFIPLHRMTKREEKNNAMQKLTRRYLGKLKHKAEKFGLGQWVRDIIKANKRKECAATKDECHMLARMVDEERIARKDIPLLFGVSYRKAEENDLFARVDKLGASGTYSRVSAIIESEVNDG